MNPSSERRFGLLRANGPAPYQPRATTWVMCRQNRPSPEGAPQPVRRPMDRPFRALWERNQKPRAMPWAGMLRTVGAEEAERDLLFHGTVAPHFHGTVAPHFHGPQSFASSCLRVNQAP